MKSLKKENTCREVSDEIAAEDKLSLWDKPKVISLEFEETQTGATHVYEGDGGDATGYYDGGS